MNELTKTFDLYFGKKAPALPVNLKKLLVQFAPWISILTVILAIPAVLVFLGAGALFTSPMMGGYVMARVGFNYTLATIFMIVTLVLRALSIPGLMSRSKSGWNMVYYSTLLYAIYSLLNFDIVGMLIGTAISLYFLFQVREYYK